MGKIVAVSVMSALVSIYFNGCGFFKSTGNQALASLGNAAGQSVSNALSSKSSSNESKAKSANDENNKGKCSGNEIKTDKSVEKGECKGGKRNGVWKYYDNYGYIQKEITFQNGEMTLEKVYDKDENLSYMTRYNKGEPEYKRGYTEKGELVSFEHFKTDSKVKFERKYEIKKLIWQIDSKIYKAKEQAQEVAQKRAESKVKKPTMQEVRNSKNAMDTYRANLQAQVEKELQIELNGKVPSIPNFDTLSDEQIIAFVNNNKLTPQQEQVYSASIAVGSLRLIKEDWNSKITFERYNKRMFDDRTTWETMGYIDGDYGERCQGDDLAVKALRESYNCRTFATQYKELIDKSAFKDKIYNALPKPKNQ